MNKKKIKKHSILISFNQREKSSIKPVHSISCCYRSLPSMYINRPTCLIFADNFALHVQMILSVASIYFERSVSEDKSDENIYFFSLSLSVFVSFKVLCYLVFGLFVFCIAYIFFLCLILYSVLFFALIKKKIIIRMNNRF